MADGVAIYVVHDACAVAQMRRGYIRGDAMPKAGELYDRDFVVWTEQQAAALRRAKGSNLPLDWDNLAEEIESLGKSDRRELRSQIRRILRHLLKLEVSTAAEPRAGWRTTIHDARAEVEDVLRDSPSLRRDVDGLIEDEIGSAAKFAAADLEQYGEPTEGVWARQKNGRYTADQVLGDWFPDTTG
jgi:uncharacterized protein DUF29